MVYDAVKYNAADTDSIWLPKLCLAWSYVNSSVQKVVEAVAPGSD